MPTSSNRIDGWRACALAVILVATGSVPLKAETAAPPPKPAAKPQTAPIPLKPARPAGNRAIVARSDWRAKPPLFAMQTHRPAAILVHHTAGPVDPARDVGYKMRALQAYSQKPAPLANGRTRKAWADVPYHFYIAVDGAIAEGREIDFSGDTNTGYDTAGHIQVVLEGNFENTTPAADQLQALEDLLVDLAVEWKVPASGISTHNKVASTLCPGTNLLKLFPDLRARVAARVE